MATIGDELPTLADIMKRLDPDGGYAAVVETMTKRSPLMQDLVFQEGNLSTGHTYTMRTGLPTVSWRRFNEGVSPSKSLTDQITETCGMLTGISKVDCALAELNGNELMFRAGEERSFLESIRQELESSFIYASTKTAPEEIMGLAPRFDYLTSHPYANQIVSSSISSSGSDQTSIWFVCHSPDTVFGIFPKGSMGGLKYTDLGKQLVKDSGGTKEFLAYVGNWEWKIGLCVRDPRYVVRIANIDTSAISPSSTALIDDMIIALHRLQDLTTGRVAIYCNRTIATYLHLQAKYATSTTMTWERLENGSQLTRFMGIPIRSTDAILDTEAILS